jgi:WD40 repeat protein
MCLIFCFRVWCGQSICNLIICRTLWANCFVLYFCSTTCLLFCFRVVFCGCGTLIGHSSCVESICVTSNSTKLFSASLDKTVIQWDIATGERLKQFRDRHTNSVVRCVCLTRDDKYLFSGSWASRSNLRTTLSDWQLLYFHVNHSDHGTYCVCGFVLFGANIKHSEK